MIIKRTETPAISSQGETIGVKIALNAKVFNMLYLDLYQYKYEAAVREVICNAIDSHVEAGITDPVKVYVPTELNPVFKVEDFGVGMSKDRLVNVYCTVSATSKDQTNNQVGMLGVGAFAPFGYTSAFNVLNGYQGTSQMLTVYQDEGIPQVKVDATFESDYQGVTVSYPVASNDLHRFRTACQRVLREFTSPIEVHGMEVEYADVEYSFNIDVTYEDKPVKVEILKDETYFRGGQVSVVMGNIRYPVNEMYVPIHYTRKVRVHVPIGAVDFMNNREDLNIEGSKSTREFLKSIREGIKAKSEEFVRSEVDKIKHPVERAVYANHMDSVFDVPPELKGLDNEEKSTLEIPDKDVEFIKTKVGKGNFVWLRESILERDKGKTFMKVATFHHIDNEKVYIVIQDDKTPISHTVKYVKGAMRISRWSKHETLIMIKKGCSQETIDSIVEFLGNTITVKKTSEMTVPIPTRKKGVVVKKDPEAWFATEKNGTMETLEQDEDTKYVLCLRGFEDTRLHFLRDKGYEVYYTSEHKYERAMETYSFLTFEEALEDAMNTGVTVEGYEEYLRSAELLGALPDWFNELHDNHPDLDIVKKFSPSTGPLSKEYAKIHTYLTKHGQWGNKYLFERKPQNISTYDARQAVRKEFEEYLDEHYPLLNNLSTYEDYNEKQIKHLVDVLSRPW